MDKSSQERARANIEQAIERLQDALVRVDEGDADGACGLCRDAMAFLNTNDRNLHRAKMGFEPEKP